MDTQKPSRSSPLLKITCVMLLIALAGSLYLNYYQWNRSSFKSQDGTISTNELQTIVSEVGKRMVLPSDETPTIATVTDPAKLKDQAFFAQAVVGDQVLVYSKAKKAILWRPSTKVIIEVAPISVDGAPASPASSR